MRKTLEHEWGCTTMVSRMRVYHPDALPGLIAECAGQPAGLLTYCIENGELEIVTLQSLTPGAGVGASLFAAARDLAVTQRCTRLWLVTTNDNTPAIAFYKRLGMTHVATHRGAAQEARRLKPQIPEFGHEGTPIEDELEFELRLSETAE
ncbi:MAG: GNAT family N-acetyltransferase [Phycisphaeraceae bacterium]|nr:GNAT family N-acetyltransferase [Phycisphaeraceae bacterium]